jgi:hypothetical protein
MKNVCGGNTKMRKKNLLAVGMIAMLSLTACGGTSTEETTTAAGVVNQEETSGKTEAGVTEATENTTTAEAANEDAACILTSKRTDTDTMTRKVVTVYLLSSTLHGFEMEEGVESHSDISYWEADDTKEYRSYISVELYTDKSVINPENTTENAYGFFVRYNSNENKYYCHIYDDIDNPTYQIQVIFSDTNNEFDGDETKMKDLMEELFSNMKVNVEEVKIEETT